MIYEVGYQRYPNGGYPVDRFDCVDNPIAQSAGIYQFDHYYHYTFLYSLLWLWDDNPNKLYFEDRASAILGMFGLTLCRTEANTTEEALAVVVHKLQEKQPPIIRTIYRNLFYCGYYLSDEGPAFWDHAIPIYRYDSDKSTVSIREQGHHFMDSTEEHRSALNIHLNVPLNLFQSMMTTWRIEPDTEERYQVYSIEKSASPAVIHSFEDILNLMLNDYFGTTNQIVKIIEDIKRAGGERLHLFMYDLNTSIHATHMLFDGIEMAESFMKSIDRGEWAELKARYKQQIQTVVNIIRKSIAKEERLTDDKLNRCKELIRQADERLFDYLEQNRLNGREENLAATDVVHAGELYYIRNCFTNHYLAVTSNENLENSVQSDWTPEGSQHWFMQPSDSGYYYIINQSSQKALDVMYTSIEEGASVGQFTVNGHWCQQWEIEKTGRGTHKIRNRSSAKLLSISKDSGESGSEIIQAAEPLSSSYEWEFIKVETERA